MTTLRRGDVPAHGLPERAALGDHDGSERLCPDDMATVHEQQLREAAELDRKRASARQPSSVPGVCTNCGIECLPLAVYCDDDCRCDHEHRVQTQRRQGTSR